MKYPAHTSVRFDAELLAVCNNVLQMGKSVEQQFLLAVDSLETGEMEAVARVFGEGGAVNAMQLAIDEQCTEILVRRQPTANDLRLVAAIVKITNDLERIGDEAESIARYSELIMKQQASSLPRRQQLKYTAEIAHGMLQAAMQAFDELDVDAAREVGRKDCLIDEEFRSILRHLVAYMMEDSSDLSVALHVTMIARSIELIGDHAKNISEYVIYMIEGREVRNFNTL